MRCPKYRTPSINSSLRLGAGSEDGSYSQHHFEGGPSVSVDIQAKAADEAAEPVISESNATASQVPSVELPDDTCNESDMQCPWCLKIISDSYEFLSGNTSRGNINCPHCDKPFKWEADYSVTFMCEAVAPLNPQNETKEEER